ncbi:MAG: type secretion system protein GspD [Pseudomonadota bacterium]
MKSASFLAHIVHIQFYKFFLVGFVLWNVFSITCWAQEPNKNQVIMNFVGADIETVVRAIGHYTGTTFVIDPRVKGTINLVSEKPVSKAQALDMLTSVLRLHTYAVVRMSTFTKVVPEAEAKQQASPVIAESTKGDQIATQIIKLNHESAAGLVNVLRPLVSTNNAINANPATNTLIITDYADNLKRLARIVAALDVPTIGELDIIKVQHAIASDMAFMINRLLDQGVGINDGGRVFLLADARTNSLILRAPTSARGNLARSLIARLDQPTALPGNVHVVYLKNAEAIKLAQVLRAVVLGEAGAATQNLNSNTNINASATTSQSSPVIQNSLSTPSVNSSAPTALAPSTALNQAPLAGGGMAGYIQADPTTNTLIITANETTYRNLRIIIDQLDARRAQVYVESLIVEVSANTAAEFGVQWAGLSGNTGNGMRVGVLTGFSTGGNNLATQAASILGSDQTAIPVGNGINVAAFKQMNGQLTLGALARALESNTKANILSMPNLITLDNEEARIIVGQNVPFITGQFTTPASGGGAGVNPFQTIERRDIGLSLRVRPQISEGGTVKMAIYQETSNIQESTSSGLITSKRSIDTNVLVDNGQIVVLGGLIEDTQSDSVEKVPLLGDIPLLGYLFRYQTKKRGKTNLMVFLRPTVIRTSNESVAVAGDRYDYMQAAQGSTQTEKNIFLPQPEDPKLPPLQNGKPVGGALLKKTPRYSPDQFLSPE